MSEREFVEASVVESVDEAHEAPAEPAPGARRWRAEARPRVVNMKRLSRQLLEFEGFIYRPSINAEFPRPKTYGECTAVGLGSKDNPCPYVSCKHHLAIDVDARTGNVRLVHPDRDIDELDETCALHVAARGGETLEDLGAIINCTRERVRQLETNALNKLRAATAPEAIDRPDGPHDPDASIDPPGYFGFTAEESVARREGRKKILSGRW